MQKKQFLITWLTTFFLAMSGVALTNVFVDPYGVWDLTRISGFNAIKPMASKHVRTAKPYQVTNSQPSTLILGNSRLEIGIDPLHACWPQTLQPVYNFGIPGAPMFYQYRMAQHALAANKPQLIIVGVDFEDFLIPEADWLQDVSWPPTDIKQAHRLRTLPDGADNPNYLWGTLDDYLHTIFSLTTLADSIVTLFSQAKPLSSHRTTEGFNPAKDYLDIIHSQGQHVLFVQKSQQLIQKLRTKRKIDNRHGQSVHFAALSHLLALTQQHNIRIILLMNPYHIDYLQVIQQTGYWQMFLQWKRKLATIAGNYHNTTLWDFATINDFILETPPAHGDKQTVLQWYWEPSHYRKALGDIMLSHLIDAPCAPHVPPFGTRLSAQNIDRYLVQFDRQSERIFLRQAASEQRIRALLRPP